MTVVALLFRMNNSAYIYHSTQDLGSAACAISTRTLTKDITGPKASHAMHVSAEITQFTSIGSNYVLIFAFASIRYLTTGPWELLHIESSSSSF